MDDDLCSSIADFKQRMGPTRDLLLLGCPDLWPNPCAGGRSLVVGVAASDVITSGRVCRRGVTNRESRTPFHCGKRHVCGLGVRSDFSALPSEGSRTDTEFPGIKVDLRSVRIGRRRSPLDDWRALRSQWVIKRWITSSSICLGHNDGT